MDHDVERGRKEKDNIENVENVAIDLSLNHGRSLSAEDTDSLEDVDDAFVLHAFQVDAEGDEDAGATDAGAAVDGDGSLLPELLLGLVNLTEEFDEALSGFGNALFGPVGKLELADGARLSVAGVRHLELAQDVLRHVVLGDGFHDDVLVADGAIRRPVLVTLVLAHLLQFGQHDDDGRVVLPQHPPEILRRLHQGSLRGDVSVAVAVAVHEAGVDVIAAFQAADGLEAHPRRLVRKHVHQPVLALVDRKAGADEAARMRPDRRQFLEFRLHARHG